MIAAKNICNNPAVYITNPDIRHPLKTIEFKIIFKKINNILNLRFSKYPSLFKNIYNNNYLKKFHTINNK